eukprot:scaffold22227_cov60-Phaeocystis_antarctica.AAC.4
MRIRCLAPVAPDDPLELRPQLPVEQGVLSLGVEDARLACLALLLDGEPRLISRARRRLELRVKLGRLGHPRRRRPLRRRPLSRPLRRRRRRRRLLSTLG